MDDVGLRSQPSVDSIVSDAASEVAATMNSRKGVVAYLLIAFGMAWAIWEIVFALGISLDNRLFKIASSPAVFAPAIAAFVVRKWITREGFADAGLRLNLEKWPYYLVAWLLPLAVVGCIVVLVLLLGLGKPDFSQMTGLRYFAPAGAPVPTPKPWWIVFAFTAFTAILGTPILFGEEFGWRGYLQLRLFPVRPVLSAFVTGLIWAAWHLPLTLRGYNFPDHTLLGALVIFPVGCIFFSIIFGWLRLQTGSIWSSSLAHSANNSVGPLILLLFGGVPSLLYISPAGLLGWIPLGALSAWIVFTGRLTPANEAAERIKQANSNTLSC